jgi:putative heme-binding domain-containing protein
VSNAAATSTSTRNFGYQPEPFVPSSSKYNDDQINFISMKEHLRNPKVFITPTMRTRILPLFLSIALPCIVSSAPQPDTELVVDPDTQIALLKGFDADLLYTVPTTQGSWVAMAFDPKGRIIVSDQDDKGVFRVTLPKEAEPDSKIEVESLKGFPYLPIDWGKRRVGGALGFIYAFDSLYMSSMKGFYRIRDTDGDDTYDEFTLLKELGVGYEHSAHSIIKTEDGKALYLVTGNHTALPSGIPSLQPPVWQTDSLLEAMPDAMGHATGIRPPAGWICRISPDGKDWKMIASGFRNPVDLAINREGELFTFDSDLEFDIGSPWYRPTRVNHVTSAGEFGWRAGSVKWPEYFADSNGAVVNVGPGSPTGISFGHHSNFPTQYQDKLFICDWTFGTIFTVDMEEDGSSYTGTKKEFLHGTPLNISAMRFGPDGHMYFLIGGRNTASKLYRIRYTGEKSQSTSKLLVKNQALRDLRHSLEQYHGSSAGAIEKAWPHLSHPDRSIRYAARLVIENQDLALWQEKVLSESDPRSIIYGAIALCRHAEKSLSARVLEKLATLTFSTLDQTDRLALLRAYSLCFIRLDKPTPKEIDTVIAQLSPAYPDKDEDINTELCRVLSYLDAPDVVKKTIGLMKATQTKTIAYDKEMLDRHEYGKSILSMMSNTPNIQNIHYAYALRQVQSGWTLEDRKYYFGWLNETLEKSGGKSFAGYIKAIRDDAIKHLTPDAAAAVSWLLGEINTVDLSKLPVPKGPAVVWTTETAMQLFEDGLHGRDFKNGKKMFSAGRCVACHRFEGSGGYSGPDLGSVGNRYSIRDILVAICEPSQSISEQYQASVVTLKDGGSVYGRVIYKNDQEIAIAPNPFNFGEIQKTPIDKVESIELSQASLMPPGTIFPMNKDELKDLIAYLISSGNRKHKVFTDRE